MRSTGYLLISLFVLGAGWLSCSQDAGGQAAGFPDYVVQIALDGSPVELAGITFTPPGDWTSFRPSGMRKASYAFGPLDGDADSATATVFYFGRGSGGDIEANIQRWVGQMSPEGGSGPAIERKQLAVGRMKVHTVEMVGTFSAGGMMGGPTVAKTGYFMSGAVLEGPEGNVFFKLTGPEKTAREMNKGFLAMIARVKSGA